MMTQYQSTADELNFIKTCQIKLLLTFFFLLEPQLKIMPVSVAKRYILLNVKKYKTVFKVGGSNVHAFAGYIVLCTHLR